jgi:hypothetical protein
MDEADFFDLFEGPQQADYVLVIMRLKTMSLLANSIWASGDWLGERSE